MTLEIGAESVPVDAPSVVHSANPAYPPSRTKGLIPFRPGESGNPSGLTKDGKSPKAQALASALQDELMQSGGMSALAKRWVQLAKKGNSTALAAILERLYPVEKDGGEGRQILTGIKLELSAGKTTATIMTALDAQNGAMPAIIEACPSPTSQTTSSSDPNSAPPSPSPDTSRSE